MVVIVSLCMCLLSKLAEFIFAYLGIILPMQRLRSDQVESSNGSPCSIRTKENDQRIPLPFSLACMGQITRCGHSMTVALVASKCAKLEVEMSGKQ